MNWYDFLLRNRNEVFERSLEHIGLVGASMAISLAIGLPLGIALVGRAKLQSWVIGAANVVQTIPSLALFGFLIPVPWIGGIGASTAIVALSFTPCCLFCAIPVTGIAEVDPAVVESARGMGMTPRQVLWQVQLPLAAPVLLAGIRVATAMSIGVTTIAAAIGAGGLGVFIFRGLAMVNNQVILAGAIPAAGLAIAADSALGYFQRSSGRTMNARSGVPRCRSAGVPPAVFLTAHARNAGGTPALRKPCVPRESCESFPTFGFVVRSAG
jgi:osmoprotectant transport system permease protein